MGQLLVRCAGEDPELEIVGTVGSSDDLSAVISGADVVIDFTNAAATLALARIAATHGKALVIGTTGHSTEDREEVLRVIGGIPVVWTSNFSTGVNILFHITRLVTELFAGADIRISETHHTKKKDAPSGTAKSLKEIIERALQRDVPIESLRIGDVVGDHTVLFETPDERIALTHSAKDRAAFARGALRAAKWILKQRPGLYDMQDVLGLRK